jgi:taurine dioxygenase
LHSSLGAEVLGVDLGQPLAAETVGQLRAGLLRYHVLLFRGQAIDDPAHIRFSRHFGQLEIFPEADQRSSRYPEIFRVANTDEAGNLRRPDDPVAGYLTIVESWHTDSAYRAIPSLGAVLRALAVPAEGGNTLFANLLAAGEALPADLRARIAGRSGLFSYEVTRARAAGPVRELSEQERQDTRSVSHPLLRRHPDRDNRVSLYISPLNIAGIEGMAGGEAAALLQELTDWATQDRFVYRHRWQADDLLMWDNRVTMHQVMPYDRARQRRVMHRTALAGTEPVMPPF